MKFDIIFYFISYIQLFIIFLSTNINPVYTKPMYITIFIILSICCFKILNDLYVNKESLNIQNRNIDTYFKIVPEIYSTIYLAFFSGWGLIFFTVLLIVSSILYSLKKISSKLMYISSYGIGITLISILAKSENNIALYLLFGIPIILFLVSIIFFVLIVIGYPISENKKLLDFIENNKEKINRFKLLLCLTANFILIGLLSPLLLLNNAVTSNDNNKKISDNMVTTFLIVSYVLSFMLIEESYSIYKIYSINKKNN